MACTRYLHNININIFYVNRFFRTIKFSFLNLIFSNFHNFFMCRFLIFYIK